MHIKIYSFTVPHITALALQTGINLLCSKGNGSIKSQFGTCGVCMSIVNLLRWYTASTAITTAAASDTTTDGGGMHDNTINNSGNSVNNKTINNSQQNNIDTTAVLEAICTVIITLSTHHKQNRQQFEKYKISTDLQNIFYKMYNHSNLLTLREKVYVINIIIIMLFW